MSRVELPPAVVIGLDCITGLQTARILARRRVSVIGLAANPRHYACRTRVCDRIVAAETRGDALVEALRALGPSMDQRGVLFPCTDPSVLAVSRHREQLEPWYRVALPGPEAVEMLANKRAFQTYAEVNGFAVPKTITLSARGDAERAARELAFPAILKPAYKTQAWERNTSAKAFRTSDPDDFMRRYDATAAWADALIAQEWIPGEDGRLFSCNCYFGRDGSPLVTFVARKIRQWPPRTGTSTLGEECRNDEVLAETVRLFEGVGLHGLGYVEMKQDPRTGGHVMIEPNVGRPTGRSAIAEAGGVELVYAAYCEVVGLPLPTALEQRYGGAKWIDDRRDAQSALHYWRGGELSISEWLSSRRGPKAHAVLARNDPGPFAAELAHAAGKAARRGLKPLMRRPARASPAGEAVDAGAA